MEELLLPAGTRAGEYEITGMLGKGGMGLVYAGVHPLIGTKVAIKTIHPSEGNNPSLVRRFLQEAQAVNKIAHNNIVDVFAFGESEELGHYLVMPLLQGETLAERIGRGALSLAEALPILRQIADALDAAHAVGICHRDLKPENVFLVERMRGPDQVKVLDFGVAKLNDGASVHKTAQHQQIGTPLFMSPEQWDGAEVDHRADIYACGVLLHHMLTGRYPFESESVLQLMHMHGTKAPTPVSEHGAPASLNPIVARALAKERDARFASVGELYEALTALDSEALESRAVSPLDSDVLRPDFADTIATPETAATLRLRRSPRWKVVTALLAGAAAAALLFVLVRGRGAETSRAVLSEREAAPAKGQKVAASESAMVTEVAISSNGKDAQESIAVRIDSRPSGSTLTMDGRFLGITPYHGTLPVADTGEFVLIHKGYETKQLRLALRSPIEEVIDLVRSPPEVEGDAKIGAPRAPVSKPKERPKWGETVNPFDP